MITSAGTEALIALEDAAPDFLFETFPGTDVLAWPLLRWPVARSMAEIELKTTVVGRKSRRGETFLRRLRDRLPNPRSAARISESRDAAFIVSGTTYAQGEGGRHNWLVDDHAAALGDRAVVLQEAAFDGLTSRAERPALAATYTLHELSLAGRLAAKTTPLDTALTRFMNDLVDRVYDQLDFDVDAARIAGVKTLFASRFARAREIDRRVLPVIDRLAPRVVFIQGASYGDRAPLIAELRKRGILVVEHQHGWIGPTHLAYNFGATMADPRLSISLPEVLLTFGDFWSEGIRFPNETIAIGKPHIEKMAADASGSTRREVLVISGMYEREEMTRFTRSLRDSLPADWEVLLRPHPAERATVAELYPDLVGEPRIRFDLAADVYESLGTAAGVFGLASTVLYEAFAFGCPVFVIDSPLADLTTDSSVFGPRISDAESTRAAVDEIVAHFARAGRLPADPGMLERLWKTDSVKNFTDFYDSRV